MGRFYFISSVLPNSKSTGGEIVLYRHFDQFRDFDYTVIAVPKEPYQGLRRLFAALEKGRFRSYVLALKPLYDRISIDSIIQDYSKPDFIVTVAHGRECFVARDLAKKWHVPLIIFFHDWYPVSSGVKPTLSWLLNREFRQLYRDADLALCVSDAMMVALGQNARAIVLPPIPSIASTLVVASENLTTERAAIQLLYTGFCGGAYKGMLELLINKIQPYKAKFTIVGSESNFVEGGGSNVEIKGFLDENNFSTIFNESDVLIVLINFDQKNRTHFSTHFPSKLIEYCGQGRLIAIWGPSYCTAIQWAKESGAAFYCESYDPDKFIREALAVFEHKSKRLKFITAARRLFEDKYAPAVIDGVLKQHIKRLL